MESEAGIICTGEESSRMLCWRSLGWEARDQGSGLYSLLCVEFTVNKERYQEAPSWSNELTSSSVLMLQPWEALCPGGFHHLTCKAAAGREGNVQHLVFLIHSDQLPNFHCDISHAYLTWCSLINKKAKNPKKANTIWDRLD